MNRAKAWPLALFGVSLFACEDLPSIPAGQCGNGVIEGREDCDTFAPDSSSSCRPPGSVGECRLDCRVRSDGTQPSCPVAWGCALDGICRPPTGTFSTASDPVPAGAWTLSAGDYDGDGRTDVLSREPFDAIGRTRVRFNYFDQSGAFSESRRYPKQIFSPVVGDVTADGRADLVFSDGRVGLLIGQLDRSWVAETFSSYRVPGSKLRIVTVYDRFFSETTPFVSLTERAGSFGFDVFDPRTGGLARRGDFPHSIEALAGNPLPANVIEDDDTSPCAELVLAVSGASELWLVDTCARSPETGDVDWREQFVSLRVPLDPPAGVDGAPLLADVNLDQHLDVLLRAGGRVYVAYGDGTTLAPAVPFLLPVAGQAAGVEIPMPLAAADFTGDGAIDFVFPDHLLSSSRRSAAELPRYSVEHPALGAPWTVAVVADVSGNGTLDVVVGSSGRLGLDVFEGTGFSHLNEFTIATGGPVEHLAVGDFDGDLIQDLAFVERAALSGQRDPLVVAFGSRSARPVASAPIARVSNVEQLIGFDQVGISSLFVTSSELIDGRPHGLLTILGGSSDRLPFAPYELTNFAADGSITGARVLGLCVGAFVNPTARDVLAIAPVSGLSGATRFWLLPELGSQGSVPLRFEAELAPDILPVSGDGIQLTANIASTVADLDRDGRDEAIWAMPSSIDAASCAIAVVKVLDATPAGLSISETIRLNEPCARAELQAVDADADGHRDLAFLSRAPGSALRKLSILWNDGAGRLGTQPRTELDTQGDSVEAFAILPSLEQTGLRLAYVAGGAARMVQMPAGTRAFSESEVLLNMPELTGIAAADVNGDNVPDLALAASGGLRTLLAQLAP